jgi:metal-responsive CopG/Arc/MetJ family transcriptional regulator
MSRLEKSTEDQNLDLSELESMARISVSLPRNLYRQFRLHALEQDTTLSALMAKLIRQEIRSKV